MNISINIAYLNIYEYTVQQPKCYCLVPALLCPPPPPPLQRGVKQFDGMWDKGVFMSVGPRLGEKQPVTEQTPMVFLSVIALL